MALDANISALQMVQCGEGLSQKSQSSNQRDTCKPIYVANQSITMAASTGFIWCYLTRLMVNNTHTYIHITYSHGTNFKNTIKKEILW